MDVSQQIEKGIVRCPKNQQKLTNMGDYLINEDGSQSYKMIGRIPCFVDYEDVASETKKSSQMLDEYTTKMSFLKKVKLFFAKDYRNKKCQMASDRYFLNTKEDGVYLSIGGGPTRPYNSLTNVNIDSFNNVDIVADAHSLPYSDGVVDGIFCEAVLEHVKNQEQCVSEMKRVLKPGGVVHSFVPFLQAYHGYPHHYQNLTITGHEEIFKRHGMEIEEAGVAVGPAYTMCSLTASFFHFYLPKPLSIIMKSFWFVVGGMLRPLDKVLVNHKDAHVLCSATYVVAKKK